MMGSKMMLLMIIALVSVPLGRGTGSICPTPTAHNHLTPPFNFRAASQWFDQVSTSSNAGSMDPSVETLCMATL